MEFDAFGRNTISCILPSMGLNQIMGSSHQTHALSPVIPTFKAILYDCCVRGDLDMLQQTMSDIQRQYHELQLTIATTSPSQINQIVMSISGSFMSIDGSSSFLPSSQPSAVLSQLALGQQELQSVPEQERLTSPRTFSSSNGNTSEDWVKTIPLIIQYTTYSEENECSLIHVAAKHNHPHVIEWFLSCAQPTSCEGELQGDESPCERTERVLLSLTDNQDATPLFYACQTSATETCAFLCSLRTVKEQLNTYKDRYGFTPLYIALKRKDYALCDLLQLFGAKIDVLVGLNESFLHYAIREKDMQMVEYVVNKKQNLLLRKNQRDENPLFSLLNDSRGGRKRRTKREHSENELPEFADSASMPIGSLLSETEVSANGSYGSSHHYGSNNSLSSNNSPREYNDCDDEKFMNTFLFRAITIFKESDVFEKALTQKNAFGRHILMECIALNDKQALNTIIGFLKYYCTQGEGKDRFLSMLLLDTDQQHRNILHLAVEASCKNACNYISRQFIVMETMSERPVDRNSISSLFSSRSAVSNIEVESYITCQKWISTLENILEFIEYCSEFTTTSLITLFTCRDKVTNSNPEDCCKHYTKEFQIASSHQQQVVQGISSTLQKHFKQLRGVEKSRLKPKKRSGSFSWKKNDKATQPLAQPSRSSSIVFSQTNAPPTIQNRQSVAVFENVDRNSENRQSTTSKIKAAFSSLKKLRQNKNIQ